jgi:hypothetical protein
MHPPLIEGEIEVLSRSGCAPPNRVVIGGAIGGPRD